MKKKGRVLSIRLNPKEDAHIRKQSERTGLSAGKMIKTVLFKREFPRSTVRHIHTADPQLTREISRIGNNINQIARAMNAAYREGKLNSALMMATLSMIADTEDQLQKISEAQHDS